MKHGSGEGVGAGDVAGSEKEIRRDDGVGDVVEVVVGEGAAPSRHANLAFSGVYKTPLHGW